MDAILRRHTMTDAIRTDSPYVIPELQFEDLYRREYPKLVAIALGLTGAREASEDRWASPVSTLSPAR